MANNRWTTESLLRYPTTGGYAGKPCLCTRNCPAACDGRCGCQACAQSFMDNGLDEKLGTTYTTAARRSDMASIVLYPFRQRDPLSPATGWDT